MSTKKRVNLTSYGTINAGDDTHEKVGVDLNQYFRKYNRRMKLYISQYGCVYQLPTYIFKISFNECKAYFFDGPVFEKFQAKLNDFDVVPEISNIFCKDDEVNKIKLENIFNCDMFVGRDCNVLEWDYYKAAYATLMDISDVNSFNPSQDLIDVVSSKRLPDGILNEDHISSEKLNEMIASAIEISWKMLKLVPPAFILFPTEFNEDWMDRKITIWDENEPHCPLIYSQPVLVYNALGQIGLKAAVGNKIDLNKMEIIEAQSFDNHQGETVCNTHEEIPTIEVIKRVPSFDEDEMYFFCGSCQRCVFGINNLKQEHSKCLKCTTTTAPEVSTSNTTPNITTPSFWEYLCGCWCCCR